MFVARRLTLLAILVTSAAIAADNIAMEIKSTDGAVVVSFPAPPVKEPVAEIKILGGDRCNQVGYTYELATVYRLAVLQIDCPTHNVDRVEKADTYQELLQQITYRPPQSSVESQEVRDISAGGIAGKEVVKKYPIGEEWTRVFVRDHSTLSLVASWKASDENASHIARQFLDLKTRRRK